MKSVVREGKMRKEKEEKGLVHRNKEEVMEYYVVMERGEKRGKRKGGKQEQKRGKRMKGKRIWLRRVETEGRKGRERGYTGTNTRKKGSGGEVERIRLRRRKKERGQGEKKMVLHMENGEAKGIINE